jgi:hypothetical protein
LNPRPTDYESRSTRRKSTQTYVNQQKGSGVRWSASACIRVRWSQAGAKTAVSGHRGRRLVFPPLLTARRIAVRGSEAAGRQQLAPASAAGRACRRQRGRDALWHRLLGRPVSECGRLCCDDGAHGRGKRRRRMLMFATLRLGHAATRPLLPAAGAAFALRTRAVTERTYGARSQRAALTRRKR